MFLKKIKLKRFFEFFVRHTLVEVGSDRMRLTLLTQPSVLVLTSNHPASGTTLTRKRDFDPESAQERLRPSETAGKGPGVFCPTAAARVAFREHLLRTTAKDLTRSQSIWSD
jgi:hypothetical protein